MKYQEKDFATAIEDLWDALKQHREDVAIHTLRKRHPVIDEIVKYGANNLGKPHSECEFIRGQKVMDTKSNKVYDFGYISQTGKAVVYYPGERNMQDATVIPLDELEAVPAFG